MSSQTIYQRDIEWTALDSALSILSPEVSETIRVYFEYMHDKSMQDKHPITKQQIEMVLRHFFDDGANILIDKFDKKLVELELQAA